jgi:hypothetical protein
MNEQQVRGNLGPQGARGSSIRYVVGLVSLISALVALAAGAIQMVRTLERGGYGTTGIDVALLWLAAGGALLGLGVSLMIWELSVRHNIRH